MCLVGSAITQVLNYGVIYYFRVHHKLLLLIPFSFLHSKYFKKFSIKPIYFPIVIKF